jgi:hypothetical protein
MMHRPINSSKADTMRKGINMSAVSVRRGVESLGAVCAAGLYSRKSLVKEGVPNPAGRKLTVELAAHHWCERSCIRTERPSQDDYRVGRKGICSVLATRGCVSPGSFGDATE